MSDEVGGVRERLAPYRRKRDFGRTPEPAGQADESAAETRRFVVQRHRARRLHYDLRFEIDGVLASWAVPKGPTLDPAVRHLAVHVEDHPIEYIDFEGIIPGGEYGGGDVIVWDHGTWEPHGTADPATAVAGGELHAEMFGEKLRGRLVLIRRDGAAASHEDWLLLHKRDTHAVDGWDPEDHPRSVVSGRTNEEVQAEPERLWRSDFPAAEASVGLDGPAPAGLSDTESSDLAALATSGTWSVFGRRLRLTHLDREVIPDRAGEPPVTKRELVGYTAATARLVLPYLSGRTLHTHAFRRDSSGKGAWTHLLPASTPAWLPRHDGQLVVEQAAALVWAVNRGAVEWRFALVKADDPERPTFAVFRIAGTRGADWPDVVASAQLHRTAFGHLGMEAFPVLSGTGGIDIWVPIRPGPSHDEALAWIEQLSNSIAAAAPDLRPTLGVLAGSAAGKGHSAESTKDLPPAPAPYSPRPAPGAPVALPIAWDELEDAGLAPSDTTVRDVMARLAKRGDPFRRTLVVNQRLPRLQG